MHLKKITSITLLFVLLIAPVFTVFMVPTTITDSSRVVSEEVIVDVFDNHPEEDVEFDTMFFTETPSSEDELHFVCRRGTDAVAYFGDSMVKYVLSGTILTLEFPGSNKVMPNIEHPIGSVTNYLLGNDPQSWKTGIEDCSVLRYSEIYPGIDLVYKFQDGNLKYEFIVSPNADPELIRLQYVDADFVEVFDDSLVINKDEVILKDTQLKVFQNFGDQEIECKFALVAKNTFSFSLDDYDDSKTLIIDPILLAYSTYYGGVSSENFVSIAVENGFIYATGDTGSSNFPTSNAIDDTYNGGMDSFVVKFAQDGQSVLFSTFLGGTGNDYGLDITVENGLVFVVGYASSVDFPTYNAMNSTHNGGQYDAVLTKLATDGQSLIYSTYLGGSANDVFQSIDVEDGYAYIGGSSYSSDFPTANGWDSSYSASSEAVITKVNPDGQSLAYSTYLGGTGTDYAYGIAVEDGVAYVTGSTSSSGFYTSGSTYDLTYNGVSDIYLTIFGTNGNPSYSTFIGGSSSEKGYDIAVKDGYAYIVGQTTSTDFPTHNAYDSSSTGDTDCVVLKMDKDGQSLVYSTYLGSSAVDVGRSIALDDGCAVVTGWTWDTDFPTFNAYSSSHNGGLSDCFVTKLSND